jgi:hypothetical protein
VGVLGEAAHFVGGTAIRTVDFLSLAIEAGYTRVLGREKYLEHEIEELKDQITRLEQRID